MGVCKPVTDIFGDKRTEINAELDSYLKDKFDGYGIIIDTVNFTGHSRESPLRKLWEYVNPELIEKIKYEKWNG